MGLTWVQKHSPLYFSYYLVIFFHLDLEQPLFQFADIIPVCLLSWIQFMFEYTSLWSRHTWITSNKLYCVLNHPIALLWSTTTSSLGENRTYNWRYIILPLLSKSRRGNILKWFDECLIALCLLIISVEICIRDCLLIWGVSVLISMISNEVECVWGNVWERV